MTRARRSSPRRTPTTSTSPANEPTWSAPWRRPRAAFTLVVMDENKPVAPRNYRGTPINFEVHGASAENYGHSGWNARSYQSGFHWGTGSALTTAVILTAPLRRPLRRPRKASGARHRRQCGYRPKSGTRDRPASGIAPANRTDHRENVRQCGSGIAGERPPGKGWRTS